MDLPRNTQNLKLIARLLNGTTPITGVAFNNPGLSVESWSDGDSSWQTVTLVDGTLGSFTANSWQEIGDGEYQFCPHNDLLVPGKVTYIKITYDSNPPWYGQLKPIIQDQTSLRDAIGAEWRNDDDATDKIRFTIVDKTVGPLKTIRKLGNFLSRPK